MARSYIEIAEATNRRGATIRPGDRVRWRGRLRRLYTGDVVQVRVTRDDERVLWVAVDGAGRMEVPIDKVEVL